MFFGMFDRGQPSIVPADQALPGRDQPIMRPGVHTLLGTPIDLSDPTLEVAVFGMGCFWGAERKFWQAEGVRTTAVGYAAGHTPHPTYKEVCSGQTAHNEVVRVVWDPNETSFAHMLKVFWESHNPTQGMRQGNDVGTQYRSGIYCSSEAQLAEAQASLEMFQGRLDQAGVGKITTEVLRAGTFYFAEDYHQQYLHKNPGGYCGLGGTGVSCPVSPLAQE